MNGTPNTRSNPSAVSALLNNTLWAVAVGVGAAVAALLLFAAVLSRIALPSAAAVPLSTVAVCLGAGCGGWLLVKRQGERALLLGTLIGLLFFVMLACAAALNGAQEVTELLAIKLFSLVTSGAAGGYMGLLASERKHRRPVRN